MGARAALKGLLCLAVLLLCTALPLQAQTPPNPPPNPTPPTPAEPADLRPGGLLPDSRQLQPAPAAAISTDRRQLPPQPLPAELEKPEDDLRLAVRGYSVSANAPPELLAALPTLLARYTGDDRSYEDLVNAAADVTRFLQREVGWYLGYAYLPAQQPSAGIVLIQLLEGRLDRIDTSAWPADLPVRREVVDAYLAQLQPGQILRVAALERVIFLLSDLRGITPRFDLLPGSQPGTATLRVTAQADPRWSGKADADVNGSRFLGTARLGALLAGNSLLGRGDALTLNGLASQSGGLYFALLGYTLPLGSDGLKLGASLSALRYQLDAAQFPLGIHGQAATFSSYALYPWVRSRNLNLFVVGTFDAKRHLDRQDAGSTVRRQIDSLTLGLSGDWRDDAGGGAVSSFEASLAAGQVRYPQGRPGGLDDAPRFARFGLGLNRLQNLVNARLLLYAALRLQQALRNLDSSEQMRIGGPDGVRAFAPGEGTGDSGWVLSAELRLLPPEAWLGRLAREMVASLFVDHGELRYRHDASEQAATFVNRAHYGGAGLSLAWERPREFALRLSLALPLSGQARSDTRERKPRLYAQFSQFF